MTKPKLYVFLATKAPIAIILRRGEKRTLWELIKWDMLTDTFTEGQWLTHKSIATNNCSLSPNGDLFAYTYDIYCPSFESHAVISRVPNFTAVYHSSKNMGRWEAPGFDDTNGIIVTDTLKPISPDDILVRSQQGTAITSGPVKEENWKDIWNSNRNISVREGQIWANNVLIYDCNNHTFINRSPI